MPSDLIYREDAKDYARHAIAKGLNVLEYMDEVPAADFRPVVRGKWGYRWKFHGDGRRPTELFPCSECGYDNASATNFCPNCGADMREES